MGFLSAYEGIRRVDLGRDYWVDLREHISQGDKEAAERAASRVRVVHNNAEVEPDVVAFRQLMVLGHIKAWNLDDTIPGGASVVWPLTIDSLKRLPGDVFEQLWQVVNELTTPDTTAERRRFPDAGGERDPKRRSRARKPVDVPAGAAALAALGIETEGPGEPTGA